MLRRSPIAQYFLRSKPDGVVNLYFFALALSGILRGMRLEPLIVKLWRDIWFDYSVKKDNQYLS
jgi:hypothetical protein